MGLPMRSSQAIRRAIVDALVPPADEPGVKTFEQFRADIAAGSPTVARATALELTKRLGQTVDLRSFNLRVEQANADVFVVDTDIAQRFQISDAEAHQAVERGMLAAVSVNRRLEEMQAYGAMMGFIDGELPVFEEKLAFLASQLDPARQEARFDRVVTLAGMPGVGADAAEGVDVKRLLEIRDTEECREFRAWLRTLDHTPDAEIVQRLDSIRARLAGVVHGGRGKALRFAATTGVGFVPVVGPMASIALGALDQFVLDKVVPDPGPITFLESSYPSLFEGR
jgi:hypothetical protein